MSISLVELGITLVQDFITTRYNPPDIFSGLYRLTQPRANPTKALNSLMVKLSDNERMSEKTLSEVLAMVSYVNRKGMIVASLSAKEGGLEGVWLNPGKDMAIEPVQAKVIQTSLGISPDKIQPFQTEEVNITSDGVLTPGNNILGRLCYEYDTLYGTPIGTRPYLTFNAFAKKYTNPRLKLLVVQGIYNTRSRLYTTEL